MTLQLDDGHDSTQRKIPAIFGYLQTHGMSHNDGLNDKNFIDLSKEVIAIVGKNGSGKSTHLMEFALAARPWNEFFFRIPNEEELPEIQPEISPYWKGGFLLDSPLEFGSDPSNYGSVNNLNLSNEKNESREILHFLFIPPASDFATNFVRHGLDWWSPHTYKEFPDFKNEMRLHGKIGLFPVRSEGASGAETSADNPITAGWLTTRVLFHSEDTPVCNFMKNSITQKLRAIAYSEESLDYGKFLDKLTTFNSNEPNQKSLNYYPLTANPLFTVWTLGGRLVWSGADTDDIRSELQETLLNNSNISIERPKHHYEFWTDLIVASIDAKLLNLSGKSDLDFLRLGRPVKRHSYHHTYGKPQVLEFWEKKKSRIIEILEEWNVIFSLANLLDWKINIEIDFESGNFRDLRGQYNETSRIWIHRACQVAMMEDEKNPYKVAIWDEPEMGLHPSAQDSIIERVIPFMRNAGIKLIFSTHSMRLAVAADSIKSCKRDEFGNPRITDWSGIDPETARELGFSKIDLLETIKKVIIVEGEMDFVVLNTLFSQELVTHRSKLLTLSGTENLLSIPNAGILVDSLDSDILIVLDGRLRSKIKQSQIELLNLSFKNGNSKEAERLLIEIKKAGKEIKEEGKKLLNLIEIILKNLNSHLLKRFQFFMFKGIDISNALPIEAVLGPKSQFKDWSHVENAMAREKIWITSTSQKEFLRSQGTPVNVKTCEAGAKALLDRPLQGDFKKLRQIAFGY